MPETPPTQTTPCPHCGSTSGIHPVDARGCAEYEARGSRKLHVSTEMVEAGLNAVRERRPVPYRYIPDLHEDLIAAYRAMRALEKA